MGELIDLAERRADRSRPRADAETGFYYDLGCPFSYFAAERVERLLGEMQWIPVPRVATMSGRQIAELRARAELRAAELRLPLVWPARFPERVPGALRTAVRALDVGAGARFGLAAARLAFCGGFDLEDPEVLAEAAAAAGLALDDCLAAAGDPSLDATLEATARGLRAQGVTELPAMRSGRRFRHGERGLTETAAAADAAGLPPPTGAGGLGQGSGVRRVARARRRRDAALSLPAPTFQYGLTSPARIRPSSDAS